MSTAAELGGRVAGQVIEAIEKGLVPRRNPRFHIAIPVDVTVLRSGVPDNVPGRSLDLGEGGLALILAGELRRGESVGIEFQLPNLSSRVQAKAMVRHEAQLRCGLEFVGLSDEQQAMIRYWAATSAPRITKNKPEAPPASNSSTQQKVRVANVSRSSLRPRVFAMAMALSSVIVPSALGWWHWRRAWQELESQTAMKEPLAESRTSVDQPIRLPAQIVERSLVHKVDPVYPANGPSNPGESGGVVVLDAVIAANGTIADLRPISGPRALTASAIEAVKWWRFQPYRINGKPVRVETTLAIDFQAIEN
jgi:outer membrane biosynthesis protein TonB